MRQRRSTGVLAPLIVLGGLALFGCGGTRRTSSTSATNHATASTPSRPPPPVRTRAPARAPLPPLGVARRVPASGTTMVVTITSVIDPLRGSGAAVPRGMKPVGVLVTVRDAGPGPYDSSATGDFALLSPAGPASPAFVPAGQCKTPLQDFMNAISPGELRTGCVAFAIPIGRAPSAVRFSPNGGSTGHSQTWAVRR